MGAPDVVVIGGGVIGLASAWQAGQAGLSAVVVDPEPGRGAAWAAAGMLAPVAEATFREAPLLRANLASQRRWPAFAAALEEASGQEIGYRECGTIVVARDRDDAAELDRLLAFRQELGLPVTRLLGRELRRREPGLAVGVRVGLDCPGDHQVDNRAVVRALEVAAQRAGARLVRQRATAVRVDQGRATGVRLEDGSEIAAGAVVLAAGAASSGLDGLGAWAPPVRPVKGQLLHLRVPEGHPPLAERVVRGLDAYIVPRADGRVVVGATVEERGFDRRVTAEGVYELLRDAYELLPGVLECELVEATTGLRPGTPDNAPIIGRAGEGGLVVATGHYRNGMLLTPLTAEAVVGLLGAGAVPEEIEALSPTRFASQAAQEVRA